ncbi:hypothetical protein [Roseisolibacter sp. H3M3-2]|uniref:hypothetical protein n=1 Tax=Roseisolibacter sp. H3M3-2 TaxID=3031323 RepID=UPI0023D9D023|nr:hypothetical protein [Roseisolibacter sp. H3M3-2]MDF1501664.1 hypothetical protein [Roseisolibacter sp. H3M3-2]
MHALLPLRHRHADRLAQPLHHAVHVERVDQHRALDLLGGTGEAAQHEHALLVDVAGDELLGHQVHPVLQRRHEAQVARTVDRRQLLGARVLAQQHDRRPVGRPPARVDRVDRRRDLVLERLVGGDLAARRRGDEQEGQAAAQLGRLLPQQVERAQPLGDPLRVVDAVDADAERAAVGGVLRAQLGGAALGVRVQRQPLEALDVDADREGADAHGAPVDADAPVLAPHLGVGEHGRHAVHEVHGVAVGVELEQVVAEQPAQHRLLHVGRQQAEDVGRREGDVPELVDERALPAGREAPPQQRRGDGEVVVLDPHHRLARRARDLLGRGLGEARVDRVVALPVLGAVLVVLQQQVAERPQRAVGEAEVEALDVGVVEPDAAERVRRRLGRHLEAAVGVGGLAVGGAGAPGHPGAVRPLQRRVERRDESARGPAQLHPVLAVHVLVRLPVGHQDERATVEGAFDRLGHRPNKRQCACPQRPARRGARGPRGRP